MKATIDRAGRIVIPREMRERLGMPAGGPVEIRERDGKVEIEPAPTPMRLRRRRGRLVAVPVASLPPLTDDQVRETVERTRR